VELVLEVENEEAVTAAALERIAGEEGLPDAERARAEDTVTADTAEALAHLVDPFDLVSEVPGVELRQASWSAERVGHDPDSPDWDLDEDDDAVAEEDGEETTVG
jgi:hypothetical protein